MLRNILKFILVPMKTLLVISLTTVFFLSTANASLILEQYGSGIATPDIIGGYTMTDFLSVNGTTTDTTLGTTTSTVDTPLGGQLNFTDRYDATIDLTRGLADSTDWWVNGENSDYDIFTTNVSWITILLPTNTRAFSFNIGANMNAGGWLNATETDGNGIESKYSFAVGPNNTPGFGIYADNSAGQCSSLTSVTIDPLEWGAGNFSINSDLCASVPEPPIGTLLGLGVAALLLSQRILRNSATLTSI